MRQQREVVADAAGQRRLRTGAQHGELVLADGVGAVDRVGVDGAGGVQAVDRSRGSVSIVDQPTAGVALGPRRSAVLGGGHAEVGGLDAQRGVVGHHRRRAPLGLAEGGADDPVVGARRIEAVLDEEVLLDAVDLDLQRSLDPSGTGSASEPPLRMRSSSIVRSAARAARPTSSGRFFRPSSSSMTVSGMTTSTSSNDVDARRDRR